MSLKILLVLFFNLFISSYACAEYEYFYWGELPKEVQDAAITLGYDEEKWDNPGTNGIENFKFSNLVDLDESGMAAIEKLDLVGIGGNCWDYFVNHYRG